MSRGLGDVYKRQAECMNNRQHVVNHLFFRGKSDLVDNNELTVMLVTNVTNEFEAEAHQPILMGNDQLVLADV